MAAGGIVAFKFVVDFGRGIQRFFQVVGPDQRGWTIDSIHFLNGFWNIEIPGFTIHFLVRQLFTEYRIQVGLHRGLHGAWVDQRVWLLLHICPQVIPLLWQILFT